MLWRSDMRSSWGCLALPFIAADVVEVPLDDFALQPTNGPELVAFLKGMEFNTITKKVATDTDPDADPIEADHIEVEGYASARGPDLDAEAGESVYEGGRQPRHLLQDLQHQMGALGVNPDAYECVRDLQRLNAWVDMIHEEGLVAVDTETNSLDPMQDNLNHWQEDLYFVSCKLI